MAFDLTPTLFRALPEYRIHYSSRARHVNLTIHPTDGLVVVVPRGFDERLIPDLIHEQRTWIEPRLEQFAHITNRDACWQQPGSVTLPATNENWTIEYHKNGSASVRISTQDNYTLRATGAIDDDIKLRASLRRWLKRRAELLLPPRLTELAGLHGFDFTRVTIRHQHTRWGSCSSHGTISLNAKLMFVSPELVDHVLLHELCHTVHPDHGAGFQALIASLEPHHRQRRAALHKVWQSMPDWAHHRTVY